MKEMKDSNGFLIVLPEQIIEISQNSNLSCLIWRCLI